MRLFFFNLFFYSVFLSYSLFLAFLFLIFFIPVKLVNPLKGSRMIRFGVWVYGRGLMKYVIRPFIQCELVRDSDKPFSPGSVFVLNHNSFSDTFVFGLLPYMDAVMVVRAWPFKIPVLGFFARHAGYLNIDEGSSEKTLRTASELIRQKVSFMIFPEGTRAGDRDMGRFHSLAFKIAMENRADIVPMVITGNRQCPKRGSIIMRPAKVTLRVLEPVTPSYYSDINLFVLKNKIRNLICHNLALMEGKAVKPLCNEDMALKIMPHKPPMLLVKRLLVSEENFARSGVLVSPDNPFLDSCGNLNEAVFPELVAQTLALNTAYTRSLRNQTLSGGFVVGFKHFRFYQTAKVHDFLTIEIRKTGDFENLTIIEGRVFYGDLLIAEGEVRIWS